MPVLRPLLAALALVLSAVPAVRAAEAADIERYLQMRSAGGPTFSPDGSEIAFLTSITGTAQVWRIPATGGWPEQWTFFRDRVSFVRWSPTDPAVLLLGKDTGGNERTQFYLLARGGRDVIPLTDRPDSIFSFGDWSADGSKISYASNKRDARFFDVYVFDLKAGRETCVLKHDGTNYAGDFSPDGKRLIVQRVHTPSDVELLVVDLATGKTDNVTPARPAKYRAAQWTPDGKTIALITDAGRDFLGAALLDPATKEPAWWVAPEQDLENLVVRPRGGLSAMVRNVDGYSRLTLVGAPGSPAAAEIKLPFAGVISSLTFSPDGLKLAVVLHGPNQTGDIWTCDLRTRAFTRLTHSSMAGLSPDDLVVPELIKYKTFDGLQVPAFFYLPPGAKRDGSLPVVIQIHGGPESQVRPTLSPVVQYLVNRGYAVLEPNVRGSSGYGKKYEHLDDVRKRMDSVRDIKAAADWLKAGGYAHPKRIACMGGSYGGFMVLASVTTFPDEWAAGVDFFGIADFESFLRNTGPYRRKLREAEYGSIENDAAFFRAISPLHKADRITAPLMVIQGVNDPRVPQIESDQIVAALRKRNRPVEYLLFPDEGHGLAKLPNRIRAYRAVAEFLDKHVKGRM
jgi:dipeptidyl aminopeptidase/acylaminoacyl peptidase